MALLSTVDVGTKRGNVVKYCLLNSLVRHHIDFFPGTNLAREVEVSEI